ncbi:MAG: hypothetical protein UX79_C0031G0005 [candidate division WWE3 bacterium GW2011_GWB1_47_11]|uniref:Uncharacterized protein n=1 Tax=candidate division WWE3 bacterium GW2011_GWB1_47_11 TaxID=1619117 RepID=A0A0G1UFN5_UNCKA|nr:MAG: hypothetical protein UX79_C0031G0005 [candidate division WWE3 bacterium GW2011_GWB1_47_11]
MIEPNKAIDKIKEAMPSGWEKMLSFAKKNPAWLMVILAILAGTGAVVAAATVPAVGIGVGAAGAGGGAFGASRKKW